MDWIMPKSLFDASGLSWDPMLKIKKVVLELIPDREMYTFFGKGRREGIYYLLIDSAKLTINIYNLMAQRKKKNQNMSYTQTQIICMVMQCLCFFPTNVFKWIDPRNGRVGEE